MESSNLSRLRHGWTPPPELNGSEPRAVRLTGNGISMLVMFLIFVPAGIAILVSLTIQRRHEQTLARRMEADGQQAEGYVTRRWQTESGYRSGPRYFVNYQFTVEGKKYSGKGQVGYPYWWKVKVSDPLPIRFLRSDPYLNYPAKFPPLITPMWIAIMMGGIFLAPGSLLPFGVRRQWRLLKYGQPVPAVVTGTRTVRGKYGPVMVVDYEFPLMDGGTGKSRHSIALNSFKGLVISVVYDPENPRRNSPYPIPKPVLVKMAGS